MNSLIELAERCEAATGPDAEIDRAIKDIAGHSWDYSADWGRHSKAVAYPYTSSLDAAMTLVPLGAGDELLTVLIKRTWRGSGRVELHDSLTSARFDSNAATPALALCAASLRARASLNRGDQQS